MGANIHQKLSITLGWSQALHERSKPYCSQFLSKQDQRFAGLHGTRDTVACQLWEEGIGVAVNHTKVLSYEEEELIIYNFLI